MQPETFTHDVLQHKHTISRTFYKDAKLILYGDHLAIQLLQNYVKQTDISDFHFLKKCDLSTGHDFWKKKASKEQIELESLRVIFFFNCNSKETNSVPEVITAYLLWGDEPGLFLAVVFC